MEWHPSWIALLSKIYDKKRHKNASFDRLDLIVHDYKLFLEELSLHHCDNPIWVDRPDYCEYREAFDRSWNNLRYNLVDTIEKLYAETWKPLDNDNRVFAPTLNEALQKMFPKVSEANIDAIENSFKEYIDSGQD